MEHAVQQVMPERMQCPVNVRSLPAGVAVIARKFRATIQAVIFAGVPIGARFRFDSTCKHCTRRRVPDRFEIRHPISP